MSAEKHVCLIQSLEISETQVLVFQTFLFFLVITYVPRRMKDACVRVAEKKPHKRRGGCPGMVQVITLSKGAEITGNSIQEYYSSINTFGNQSLDVLGMVQTYGKNNLHPHSSSFKCKRQYLSNSDDNILFWTNLLTALLGWPGNAWHLSEASSRLDLETLI